ncbi:MAG: SusE domain-containing protein [Bacteroidaceae bacterium]
MKKIYWSLLLLIVVVLTGCNSEQEYYAVDTVQDGMLLSVSKDTVSLSQNQPDETAVTFSWNSAQVRKNNGITTYYIKIGLASDTMATATKVELTESLYQYADGAYQYSISNWDLIEIVHNLGINYGVAAKLKAEIIAESDGDYYVKPEISTVEVVVNTFKLTPVNLYLVGTANPYGSELSNGIKLTEVIEGKVFGNKYEWEGYLQAGTFKFVNSKTENNGSWSMGANSTTLQENATSSSSDTEFSIAQSGVYSISLNKDELKVTYSADPDDLVLDGVDYITLNTHKGINSLTFSQDDVNYTQFHIETTGGDPWIFTDFFTSDLPGNVLKFRYKSSTAFDFEIFWCNPTDGWAGGHGSTKVSLSAATEWTTFTHDYTDAMQANGFVPLAGAYFRLDWGNGPEGNVFDYRSMHFVSQ